MDNSFREIRFASVSFFCLLASWLLLWSFISSGANSNANTWLTQIWVYSGILTGPIAVLIAIAGIFVDRRKSVAVVALLLSLVSTLVVLSIGG